MIRSLTPNTSRNYTTRGDVTGADPYQGDLSQVVSKYLGETEQALRRLLEEAESGLTVLVFDEADDLFGR